MDEKDFWVYLEFRICDEFKGLPEKRHRRFWCDGFIPYQHLLKAEPPRILGRCWMVDHDRQMEWDFALILPQAYNSVVEIPWQEILPPDGVTRWMSFDEQRRYLEVEPAVAVPDLSRFSRPRRRKTSSGE